MENVVVWIGRVSGLGGILLCILAVTVRMSGRFLLGAFQIGTVLEAGIAAMILGCFCFLAVLMERVR